MVEATNRLYYGRAPGIDWFICQDTYTHGVFTPEQDNDKTTTRQMLNLCIPIIPLV